MNTKLEKHFEEIADIAIEAAEEVDCEGQDFVAGLKVIETLIRARLEMARDEFTCSLLKP